MTPALTSFTLQPLSRSFHFRRPGGQGHEKESLSATSNRGCSLLQCTQAACIFDPVGASCAARACLRSIYAAFFARAHIPTRRTVVKATTRLCDRDRILRRICRAAFVIVGEPYQIYILQRFHERFIWVHHPRPRHCTNDHCPDTYCVWGPGEVER